MEIFMLMDKIGQFETEPYKDGYRAFGFWSYKTPNVGDLVVKPHMKHRNRPTVWRILNVEQSFRGSNGEVWWVGRMKDLFFHKCITNEEAQAILSDPVAASYCN